MNNVNKQKYNPDKIEMIYDTLTQYADSGIPSFYKIKVDGMEVVRRTQNLAFFHCYENMIDEFTDQIEISIFQGKSMHSDRHIFYMNGVKEEKGTITEQDIDAAIQRELTKVKYQQMEQENLRLKEEKQQLIEENREQFELIRQLGDKIQRKEGGALEQLMSGEAGKMLMQGMSKFLSPSSETEAQKTITLSGIKPYVAPPIAIEDKKDMEFVQSLRGAFTASELQEVIIVLDHLKNDKESICLIGDLLKR